MCLGIPGRVVELEEEPGMIARVEVMGVPRDVNIALVREEGIAVGDWVLLHLGFALEVIDEEQAERAMDGLRLYAGDEDVSP